MVFVGSFEEEVANYWEEQDREYALHTYTKVLERRNKLMATRRNAADTFRKVQEGIAQVLNPSSEKDLAQGKRA